MATFLVATLTNSGIQFRPVQAADLATLEAGIQARVTAQLATGRPAGIPSLESLTMENLGGNTGRLDGELLIPVISLDAVGKLALGGTTVTWV